ncbi:MAG: hypothetical protein GVX78_05505 [Bacteroidetes bacterium]|jgi:small nuclear ribonucleoprotein (snRNP)-like protein|nr:hypothetical protein [Bacteroidota bacterium]
MKTLFFVVLSILSSTILLGQNSTELPADSVKVLVTLKNGDVYKGEIIDKDPDKILLQSKDQAITLLRENIFSIQAHDESKEVRVVMKDGQVLEGVLIESNTDKVILQNRNGRLTLQKNKVERIEEQLEKEQVKIVMKDGAIFEGYQQIDGKEQNTIYTENGKIEYNPGQVKKISKLQGISEYGFENPVPTKYFLGPSAIPLQKGNSYYHNQAVIFNSFQTGVGKNVSIGGGLEFLSLFVSRSPLIYGNLKITASASDRFHYGGGLVTGGVLGGEAFSPTFFVAPYAVITLGGYDHNITFGGSGVLARFPFGIFTLSGMTRVSRKVSLISNNYFTIGDSDSFPDFGIQGIRIMNTSNAFDIGLLVVPELIADGIILPYAGFIQRF